MGCRFLYPRHTTIHLQSLTQACSEARTSPYVWIELPVNWHCDVANASRLNHHLSVAIVIIVNGAAMLSVNPLLNAAINESEPQ
jgi:hypothetical protein